MKDIHEGAIVSVQGAAIYQREKSLAVFISMLNGLVIIGVVYEINEEVVVTSQGASTGIYVNPFQTNYHATIFLL